MVFLGIFSYDSKPMRFAGKLADLIWLNILTSIFCIPVITSGAAFTACHYVLFQLLNGQEGNITKTFWSTFKSNFKQATLIWLICLVCGTVALIDLQLLLFSPGEYPKVLLYVVAVVAVILLMSFSWVFVLQMRYQNSPLHTLRNAFAMTFRNLIPSFAMAVLILCPIVLALISGYGLFVALLGGITLPGYFRAMIYCPILKKMEQEETALSSAQ